MTQEFSECLNKYTKEHHESSGKAETPEQYQVSNNENYQFNILWPSVKSMSQKVGKTRLTVGLNNVKYLTLSYLATLGANNSCIECPFCRPAT